MLPAPIIVRFGHRKPDGTPRKLLETSRMEDIGWTPDIGLREGIERTHEWFLEHEAERIPSRA